MPTDRSAIRDYLALTFASFFPLVMSSIYFIGLRGTENYAVLTAFSAGKFVQFAFPAPYVFWFYRDEIGFPRLPWRGMPLAIAFGAVVGMSMWGLYYFFVQHIPAVAEDTPKMIYAVLRQMKRDTPAG